MHAQAWLCVQGTKTYILWYACEANILAARRLSNHQSHGIKQHALMLLFLKHLSKAIPAYYPLVPTGLASLKLLSNHILQIAFRPFL